MDTSFQKEQTEEKVRLFEENRVLQGFSVYVMEDMGFKTRKRFITPKEKELYIKEFGHKRITDSEFFDWWSKINKLGKYASKP